MPEDFEAFGSIRETIGRLPVIAPLDPPDVDDLVRVLQTPKNSLIQQFRKLIRFHGADLLFTDAAVGEIAKIALERGTGVKGLKSVVETVVEGVMFEAEARVRYLITDKTVGGGEVVKQRMNGPRAPLGSRVFRRPVTKRLDNSGGSVERTAEGLATYATSPGPMRVCCSTRASISVPIA
jgi:hypothetical protein